MGIYVWVLFIIAEIGLVVSIFSLLTQPKLQVYRILSVYAALTSLLTYGMFRYGTASEVRASDIWFLFLGIGFIQPSLILHLTLSFIGYTKFFRKTNNFLMVYSPALLIFFIFIYTNGFNEFRNILLSTSALFWVTFFNLASVWLIWRFSNKITVQPKRSQTKLILIGRTASTGFWIIILLSQLIISDRELIKFEYFAIALLIDVLFFGIALIKYRLITYDYRDVVDDVIGSTSTIVALLTTSGRIVKINSAVERLLQIPAEQFIDSNFNKLLYFGNEKEGWNSIVASIPTSGDAINLELVFRNHSGEKILVNVWIKPIYELGLVKGYSVTADDSREIMKYKEEIETKDSQLEKEREIRKISSDLYLKIREAAGFNLSYVLEDVLSTVRTTIGLADVYIVMGKKIVSDPDVSFATFISTNIKNGQQLESELKKLGIKYEKFTLSNDPKLEYSFLIAVPNSESKRLSSENIQHLRTLCNSIGAALENTILGAKNIALENIADRVVYIESEEFYKIASDLNGESFEATYLVADLADSLNLNIHQDELQTLLKDILKSHGAVWGNAWGDMIHGVFSDKFKRDSVPASIRAYLAAIEICQSVKDHFDASMKVGLATGPISISKDTSQMNQDEEIRIIEKSAHAQEGRQGVSTLQQPDPRLVQRMEDEGWIFMQTKDLVRGDVKDVWRIQKQNGTFKVIEESSEEKVQTLNYDTSLKVLLTKGVDGHEHFEGGGLNSNIIKIIRKAGEYFNSNPEHNERFIKLTGRSSMEILGMLDDIETWGEGRQQFDFAKHFLPWLFVVKLAEASNPDIIYELTKAQLNYDLNINSGVSKEISPFVWIEMGMDYEACMDAFVSAVEDSLKSNLITGPVEIGVGIKRQHLVKNLNNHVFPEVSRLEFPYLSGLKLVEKLRKSAMLQPSEVFVDLVDMEQAYPLFSHSAYPARGNHTRKLFNTVKELGVRQFIHSLEAPFNPELAPDKPRDHEFSFIVELLEELSVTNPRFIHMAYWSANLPHLNNLKAMNAEIAVCPSSTHILGSTHKPISPFLLKKRNLVEGLIYDPQFPRIIVSSDDSGPFSIRNIWEELEVVYHDLTEWFDKEIASLALIQLLRNSYRNMSAKQISDIYKLDTVAVEWFMAYDIYTDKSELSVKEIRSSIILRVDKLLSIRRNLLR